jgi:hypothetical protein
MIYTLTAKGEQKPFFDSPPVMGLLSSSNPPHTSK